MHGQMNSKGAAWSKSIREPRHPKQVGPCKPSLVSPVIAHRSEYPEGPAAAHEVCPRRFAHRSGKLGRSIVHRIGSHLFAHVCPVLAHRSEVCEGSVTAHRPCSPALHIARMISEVSWPPMHLDDSRPKRQFTRQHNKTDK